MKIAVQPQIPGLSLKRQLTFGGSDLTSHPKEQRAIPLDRPIHLVMRSLYAKGPRSFLRKDLAESIFAIIERQARRFNVKLYRYANAGNHLHMVVKPSSRRGYKGFIRSISGLMARLVLKVERGLSLNTIAQGSKKQRVNDKNFNSSKDAAVKKNRFWQSRPFTRILSWGRDFKGVSDYLMQNTLEAIGFIAYKPRLTKGARYPRARIRDGTAFANIKLDCKLIDRG